MRIPRRAALRALSCTLSCAALGALTLAATATTGAHAQTIDWPQRPLRILVPSAPGGAYDKAIRPLALEMAAILKQPIVIENRPSAGNIVATQTGAKAPADGYTLTMTGMMNTMVAGIYDNLPFDILKDFEHVGGITGGAQWLVVRTDAGFNTLDEMLQKARREPGSVHYATSGAGSTGHLMMELLQREAKVQLTHVPYKGGAPALLDTLAGVVPAVVVPLAAVEPHVKAGKLKVLAASTEQRSAKHPDIPTFAELGYKQLTVSSWAGLSVPKGTPDAVVRKLSAALQAGLQKPQVTQVFDAEGMFPMGMGPEEYTKLMQSDFDRWGKLSRSLGLKAN
jgi:tripartite-type tricarboxylate transporter receptor subunit TctC